MAAGHWERDQVMEMSPIVNDFAAIARRLNEILEEARKADERAAQPPGRFDNPYQLVRSPRGGGEATRPRHH